MQINEVKRAKDRRNGVVFNQGGQHGVCHGGGHQENNASHVSAVKRLGHGHFVKMVFAILYISLQWEWALLGLPTPSIFFYFSSNESSNFLMSF